MYLIEAVAVQSTFKRGDRLVVNYGTLRAPEYYVATVVATRADKVKVKFDDETTGVYLAAIRKDGILGKAKTTRVRKTQIPTASLEDWLVAKPTNSTPTELTEDEIAVFTRLHGFLSRMGMTLLRKVSSRDGGPWLIYTKGDNFLESGGSMYYRFEVRRLPKEVSRRELWEILAHIWKKSRDVAVIDFKATARVNRAALAKKIEETARKFKQRATETEKIK